MDNNTKTGFDSKEAKDRIKKLEYLLKNDVALYNHLTRNGYIEYILNGDSFPYNNQANLVIYQVDISPLGNKFPFKLRSKSCKFNVIPVKCRGCNFGTPLEAYINENETI